MHPRLAPGQTHFEGRLATRRGDMYKKTEQQLPQIADLGLCITIQRFQNQMHFPSSVNGSLLTPSFLRGDCPKLHAITAETNTPGLHVRYCKFHNSCKQGQTAAQWQPVPPSMPGASSLRAHLPLRSPLFDLLLALSYPFLLILACFTV